MDIGIPVLALLLAFGWMLYSKSLLTRLEAAERRAEYWEDVATFANEQRQAMVEAMEEVYSSGAALVAEAERVEAQPNESPVA